MKYLLDTHALLWYLFDSENLSQTAKEIINNEFCYYSKVSLWEIAIKQSGNKYHIDYKYGIGAELSTNTVIQAIGFTLASEFLISLRNNSFTTQALVLIYPFFLLSFFVRIRFGRFCGDWSIKGVYALVGKEVY